VKRGLNHPLFSAFIPGSYWDFTSNRRLENVVLPLFESEFDAFGFPVQPLLLPRVTTGCDPTPIYQSVVGVSGFADEKGSRSFSFKVAMGVTAATRPSKKNG
jgi:hypothetical protein